MAEHNPLIEKYKETFELHIGDIRDLEICRKAEENVEYVFHEAALSSDPRSIKIP